MFSLKYILEVDGMLKMNIKENSTKNETYPFSDLESNTDMNYLKGIFDAIRYVGGDLDEYVGKQDETQQITSAGIMQSIASLTKSPHFQTDLNSLRCDVLIEQSKVSEMKTKLKTTNIQLQEKDTEIKNLRSELEKKNIMLSMKGSELNMLSIDHLSKDGIEWCNSKNIQSKLRDTEHRLAEKQDEVTLLRNELEQRNILLSMMKHKLDQF